MAIKRIFDIVERCGELFPEKPDSLACKRDGKWLRFSSKEYVEKINLVSKGLLSMGIQAGAKIVTVSNNRPEWNFLDLGMSQIGVVNIPIYTTVSDADFDYIIKHSEPEYIVVSDAALYKRISKVLENVTCVKAVFTFNDVEGAENWEKILEAGKKNEQLNEKLTETKSGIKEDDLATIIYTSGTTGNPKGVMLSHKNIVSNLKEIEKVFPFKQSHLTLSFLPISHVFERTINYYFQYQGVSVYYAESMGTISANIKEVKPNILITVPRLLEVIYDKIIGIGKDLKGIKKQIFFWAVNLGMKYNLQGNSAMYNKKLNLARKLVFKKWQEALGGNVDLIIAGGAALQPRLVRIFNAAGIPLGEGYGMTETSPVISACSPWAENGNMEGTVGKPLPGLEVKISDDGEIITRSNCVMQGYYKEPELTAEVIDEDGWMHTGDVGEFVNGGFLKITDRKKEIFKLSSGKYIAPQLIENKFKESFFIEQAMVIGENQKFASAILSPNFTFLHDYCSRKGIKYRDNAELVQNPQVIKRIQKEVNEINKVIGQTEQIKRFRIVHEEWSVASGELSPTLKLKRKKLKEKYGHIISEIYSVEKE